MDQSKQTAALDASLAKPRGFDVTACNSDVTNKDSDGIQVVCKHWQQSWIEAGFSESNFQDDWIERTTEFVRNAGASLQYKTFFAKKHGNSEVIGSISCQEWAGPIPWVVDRKIFSLGTIWGLHVDPSYKENGDKPNSEVESSLVQAAVCHLRRHGCKKVVTLTITGYNAFVNSGFKPGNMLTLDLRDASEDVSAIIKSSKDNGTQDLIRCHSEGHGLDATVCEHWKKMWKEVGIPGETLFPNMVKVTLSFIQDARERLHYQTLAARHDGRVVGSASCQIWEGPFPKIAKPESFQLGTIWAVYVSPEYRRKGIATALMRLALAHLRDVGCHAAILIAASEAGQSVYERLGFRPNNALVCDIQGSQQAPQPQGVVTTKDYALNGRVQPVSSCVVTEEACTELETQLSCLKLTEQFDVVALLTATPRQLSAALEDRNECRAIMDAVFHVQRNHNLYVDPKGNWFTQNIKSFGRGFDMKALAKDPNVLASKFDRLSTKYDHWTVGNQSKVESFIAKCTKDRLLPLQSKRSEPLRVLDVACGIGLQGQVMRLCGFVGDLVGTDVSPGMVKRVVDRGCYNHAFVANANQGFNKDSTLTTKEPFNVVICTGAMELLEQRVALLHMAEMIKPHGELWVSFQQEHGDAGVTENPTNHQNITGITEGKATEQLSETGFEVVSIDKCKDAFYTPSPEQNGSLNAVPYLFVVARKMELA